MENDNEINKIVEKSKQTFLTDDLLDQHSKPEIYSLEKEFAETKKNRKPGFILVLFLFLAIIGAGSYFFTKYVQTRSKQTVIPISDFEDINLQEILNKAKNTEAQLEFALKELSILKTERSEKISEIKDKYQEKKVLLLKKNLAAGEMETQKAELARDRQKEIDELKADYDKKIKAKEEEIKTIRKNIAEHRRKLKSETEKVKAAINNYQRLFDLKLNKVRAEYDQKIRELILKYNPYMTEWQIKKILRSRDFSPRTSLTSMLASDEYTRLMAREGAWNQAEQTKLKNSIRDNLALIDRMRKVPYKNSVPGALDKIRGMSVYIINDYESRLGSLYQILLKKNSQISNYHYAFDYLLYSKPESGYIIDPRNSAKIRVYMNEVNRIANGVMASVFRNDDEFIAEVSLYRSSSGVFAKVVQLSPGKKIQPFDKILLKIK